MLVLIIPEIRPLYDSRGPEAAETGSQSTGRKGGRETE